jgi:hypothetical protein
MSAHYPDLAHRAGRRHPAVASQRSRERLAVLLSGLIALVAALGISVYMPNPGIESLVLAAGIVIGVTLVVTLIVSTRYTVTLTLLALYLGLLDGPIKLEASSKFASGFRDILIIAIGLGMLMRLGLRRERVALPPLSGWVLAFVALTVVEALNPGTNGILKVIGGYRQELEFVPLFFFAYLIMRSKQRFRQLFLILGVIALVNGLVGVYQSRISTGALSAWGPGYGEKVSGTGLGRTYKAQGESHNRPPALGSDSGFGGGVGVLALPGLVAMLAAGRLRRRWPVVLCCLGALLGVATAASRTSVIIAVVSLVAFVGLAMIARLRVSRAVAGLAAIVLLAGGVGWALVTANGSSIFHRQESLIKLAPGVGGGGGGEAEEESSGGTGGDAKTKHLNEIPKELVGAPLGLGLGVAGSAGGFGGHEKLTIESEKVSGGSAYNLLVVELGAAGLFLWIGFTVNVLVLGIRRLKLVEDRELRMYLVAVLSSYIAFTIQGLAGVTLAVTPAGAYLWFVPGIVAYWFAGPGIAAIAKKKAIGGIAPARSVTV